MKRGVSSDTSKVTTIEKWQTPTNIKEDRGFLGMDLYYRKFIKHYGIIARPLTDMLKKGVPFVWTSITEEAFVTLKHALVSALVLALPDFSKPFMIKTDACEYAVGAVFHQEGHPIAYLSKAMGPRTKGLSTYEKEALAILEALKRWRHYLLGKEVIIRTDQ